MAHGKWLLITLSLVIIALVAVRVDHRRVDRSRFPQSTESAIAAERDTVLVLAMAPETCMTCEPILAPWIDATDIPVVLLLTSSPSEGAARDIIRIRLPFSVVVSSTPTTPREEGVLRAVLYCGHRLKDSLTVRGLVSRTMVSDRFGHAHACRV
jgi:hypothetical protein